jgi:hypothetical protein
MQELLGDLFIHPKNLHFEKELGHGAFATVHRARCGDVGFYGPNST